MEEINIKQNIFSSIYKEYESELTHRVIFSVDMKSFYAYVECLERKLDPFKTKLVVCDKERGKNTIILSVSPYLKSLGVPNRLRIRELPTNLGEIIYAKPHMENYIKKSAEVISIFLDFVDKDDLHVYSIDESFLDVTQYIKLNNTTKEEYAKKLLKTIKEKTGLLCTCGIGENIFMAKCAMDIEAKHNKNYIASWNYSNIIEKLWNVSPLSKMWGIGPRLEKRLNNLGFFTVGEIACSEKEFIKKKLGVIGEEIYMHSFGIDNAIISNKYTPISKSLSCGQVLMKDYGVEECETIVKEMVDELCEKLRKEKVIAKTFSLMILYSKDIGGFAKQISLANGTDSNKEISEYMLYIYRNFVEDFPIRRVNVSAGELTTSDFRQENLFSNDSDYKDKERKINKVVDEIKKVYGKNSIVKLSNMLPESTAISRNNQIGGHNK